MKTKDFFTRIALAMGLLFVVISHANNLIISNTNVTGNTVTFDVSWDNSWYTDLAPANFDAVWIFVKYQDCSTRLWQHANLAVSGHSTSSPLQIQTVTDNKGLFLRRSAFGGGNIPTTGVTMILNIPAGTYNYKVYGVEMVNIPQGDFQIGDGVSTSRYNSISITSALQSSGIPPATIGGASVNVPATFPMGYNAFYTMKYEITQEQYVEFLNTLTYDQQKERTGIEPNVAANTDVFTAGVQFRNGIKLITPGNNNTLPAVFACDATAGVPNNSNDGQNIAMNYMSWADLTAYLDWSALRPMTELEFEKICRGPLDRVAGEYPWGSAEISNIASNSLSNPYLENENIASVANGRVMAVVSSTTNFGPSRVGVFATNSSGRAAAGASYFGVMEMAGNVWERTITTGNATGVAFTGALGDGNLSLTGDANVATWPGTDAVGAGFRGGGHQGQNNAGLRTSDRSSAATATTTRTFNYGGRGVR